MQKLFMEPALTKDWMKPKECLIQSNIPNFKDAQTLFFSFDLNVKHYLLPYKSKK